MRPVFIVTCLAFCGLAGPAAADACCILKSDKGNVCVNAPGPTCRSHPRYVSFNQKKLCKKPGASGNFTCRNKRKNELSARIAYDQRHITLEHLGHEYEKDLMIGLQLSLENEKAGISIGNRGIGLQLKFGD